MVHSVENVTEEVMPDNEGMSTDERRKYLRLVAPRYAKAGHLERSRLLMKTAAVTGLHRKSVIRLPHAWPPPSLAARPLRTSRGVRRHAPD